MLLTQYAQLWHGKSIFTGTLQAGLDSLGAIELRNAVSAALSMTLPVTAAFDFPTIQAMAQHISTLLSVPTSAALKPDPAASTTRVQTKALFRRTRQQEQPQASQPIYLKIPDRSAQDDAAAQALIGRLVRDILGASAELQQPLMEASAWLHLS